MKRMILAAFQLPSDDNRDLDDYIFEEISEDDDLFETLRDKFNSYFTTNIADDYDSGNVIIEYATQENVPSGFDYVFKMITQYEYKGDLSELSAIIAFNSKTHEWKFLDPIKCFDLEEYNKQRKDEITTPEMIVKALNNILDDPFEIDLSDPEIYDWVKEFADYATDMYEGDGQSAANKWAKDTIQNYPDDIEALRDACEM